MFAYSSFLFYVGDHDHNAAVVLPNHLPKVGKRVGHRTLCGNVGVLLDVTLFVE